MTRLELQGPSINDHCLNSSHLDADLDKETQTFWSVAVRYLRKRLDKDQVLIPNVIDDVTTTKVDDQSCSWSFRGKNTEIISLGSDDLL